MSAGHGDTAGPGANPNRAASLGEETVPRINEWDSEGGRKRL